MDIKELRAIAEAATSPAYGVDMAYFHGHFTPALILKLLDLWEAAEAFELNFGLSHISQYLAALEKAE